jgi:hypothetical protein
VDEIKEVQAEMMEDFKDEKKDTRDERVVASAAEKAQRAQQWIDQLEQVRRRDREEQQRMEVIVDRRRRELQMERMATQRCLESPMPSPAEAARSPQTQVRAQERLLSQWKQSYRSREPDIAAIRERQQAILERLQGGL